MTGDPEGGPGVPFSLPEVGAEESGAVAEALASGWLTAGPRCRELEEGLARRLGARHAVALTSCTAALHLALVALDARPGEVVLTSPYTFTSGAEVALHAGLEPVFCDIDARTLNLDPAALRKAAAELRRRGRKVAAILPTHIGGHPCDMEAVDRLADELGAAVVEDAAHALPASYRGVPIGARRPSGHPRAVCFSFYANKTMTTGEGGMLTTDDPLLAERCRRLALHGIDRDAWSRERGSPAPGARPAWHYEVGEAGFKANMSDLAAAVGLAQLAKLDTMAEKRRRVARRYQEAFSGHPALECPTVLAGVETSWHLYVLRLRPGLGAEIETLRDRFAADLGARGIGTSLHYRPLHLHGLYRRRFGLRPEDFPTALAESRRALSLPIYSRMSRAEAERVIAAVLASLDSFL